MGVQQGPTGSYDCVDRIVLNAYFPLATTPAGSGAAGGGCTGSDDDLDNTRSTNCIE